MSASMMPTVPPHFASAIAMFTATVVLPTPPLPAPTAITFFTPGSDCRAPSHPTASRTRALLFTTPHVTQEITLPVARARLECSSFTGHHPYVISYADI